MSALKSSIDSRSPSRLASQEGFNFTDGFTLAIEDGKKDSVRAAELVGKESIEALGSELDHYKQTFGALSFALESNKQTLKVEHEINNSGLENKIASLEGVLEKLITVMDKDKETIEHKEQPIIMNVSVRNDEDINKIDEMLNDHGNRRLAAWGG